MPGPERRQPVRTCLGCREAAVQDRLIRFVRSPEGAVLVDYRGKLPGRGAYTCCRRACVEAAVTRRQFDRAFRKPCRVDSPEDLCRAISAAIRQRIVNLVGMARKSSQLVSGSNALIDALRHDRRFAVIITAEDISAAIADKINGLAARSGITTIKMFDKTELGRILGRSERSAMGLKTGKLSETLLADWQRYKDMSGVD